MWVEGCQADELRSGISTGSCDRDAYFLHLHHPVFTPQTQKKGRPGAFPFSDCGSDVYRFEYWNRFLAPFCPYFFRSLTRESLVSKPSFFKGVRRGWLSTTNARAIA